MPRLFLGCLAAALVLPLNAQARPSGSGVQVTPNVEQRRVDITIDGAPFTSYVWPTTLKKPVLYPLIAPGGIEVTRGFPLAPRPGERVDHPHHAGMWFNYGNANGFDFWNNSDAIKPEDRGKMGTINQEKIVSTKSGPDQGELVVESVWVTGANREILRETTRYVFTRRQNARIIDQITTLQALDQVVFHDDKEGLLGIRVARWLESPDEKGGTFTDASGRQTTVPDMSRRPARPASISPAKANRATRLGNTRPLVHSHRQQRPDVVTIAILDHPGNPNYPTYWHARGYGLFAANPLGQHIFDPKTSVLDYTLKKGQSATFRYRVLLIAGKTSAGDMDKEADGFAALYPPSETPPAPLASASGDLRFVARGNVTGRSGKAGRRTFRDQSSSVRRDDSLLRSRDLVWRADLCSIDS